MPQIFDELPSTQSELKKRILSGKHFPHLDYLLAHHQTDGKGRQNRAWISSKGNLYLSFWLAHHRLPLTWIPLWISVCLHETFLDFGVEPVQLLIKWPNDLIVDGHKKIAGIVCEKIGEGILVGVGANLVEAPEITDRKTAHLLGLVPELEISNLNVRFMKRFLESLATEPTLEKLKSAYERVLLLKQGMALSWMDLQTGAAGDGIFLRLGEFGELIVREGAAERTLLSEEIKLHFK